MIWEDECYLLSKRKFKENANIINVFSKERGKISGLVYGGNSRKIRNYLQISNKLFVEYNSKNENKIGYFKTKNSTLQLCYLLLSLIYPTSYLWS